jgi:RNA polymerase sigma factor (sigma-70 family)
LPDEPLGGEIATKGEKMMEKDYKIILKIKNNRLLSLIKKAGYSSITDFCRAAGIQSVTVYSLINFKKSPINQTTGKWTRVAIKISNFLEELPDYVFPEHMRRALNNHSERDLSHGQMLFMAKEISQQSENVVLKKHLLGQLSACLTERESQLIRERFYEEKTLEQCGVTLGVSRDRARQIEAKALRKLRKRANAIKMEPRDFL